MHAIVICMMALATVTYLQLQNRLLPDLRASYLPWFCLFVSMDAMVTKRALRRFNNLGMVGIVYRLLEWVVILISLKAVQILSQFSVGLLLEPQFLLTSIARTFFNNEYLVGVFAVMVVWWLSSEFGEDLSELEGDETLLEVERLGGAISNRPAVRERMVGRIFFIGVSMVVMGILVRLDGRLHFSETPLQGTIVLNIVLYFLLSLVLLSQTQLAVLRAGWSWDQIPIHRDLAWKYAIYSFIFIAFIAALSFLLPTRYTLGFLSTLNTLIYMGSRIVHFITSLFYFFISLLFLPIAYLLSSLFDQSGIQPVEPAEFPAFPQPQQTGDPIAWLEFLKSLLFWGIFLGIVIFAFYQYYQQNREMLQTLRQLPALSWFFRFLSWLGSHLGIINKQAGQAFRAGFRKLRFQSKAVTARAPWRYVNLRKMPARERVLFLYLAMLKRLAESGIARKSSQTPYEYARVLESDLTDVDQEVAFITDAFIEARYSRHIVTKDQANFVQRWWEQIRRAIHHWRR